MRTIASIACISVGIASFAMPAAGTAQGKKGGGTAIPMVSTHDAGLDISPDAGGPYENGLGGVAIVVDGDYRMTMSCGEPGSCTRSFTVQLVPAAGSTCGTTLSLGTARLTLYVDAVQTVGSGPPAMRPARAQVRELVNGEAVGALYTLWWGSHSGSDAVQVAAGVGTNTWEVSTAGDQLAMLQVPGPKGKAVLCGLVHASFRFTTAQQP
jgi:hypothetical protein